MNNGKLIEVSQTFKKQFEDNRLGGIIITARKYREEGLNLHDIACALLFGEKEIRHEIIGFHLLNYF